jgi:hypothetical protein
LGRRGSMWSHGCALEIQRSAMGSNQLGSSRLPALTTTMSARHEGRAALRAEPAPRGVPGLTLHGPVPRRPLRQPERGGRDRDDGRGPASARALAVAAVAVQHRQRLRGALVADGAAGAAAGEGLRHGLSPWRAARDAVRRRIVPLRRRGGAAHRAPERRPARGRPRAPAPSRGR